MQRAQPGTETDPRPPSTAGSGTWSQTPASSPKTSTPSHPQLSMAIWGWVSCPLHPPRRDLRDHHGGIPSQPPRTLPSSGRRRGPSAELGAPPSRPRCPSAGLREPPPHPLPLGTPLPDTPRFPPGLGTWARGRPRRSARRRLPGCRGPAPPPQVGRRERCRIAIKGSRAPGGGRRGRGGSGTFIGPGWAALPRPVASEHQGRAKHPPPPTHTGGLGERPQNGG